MKTYFVSDLKEGMVTGAEIYNDQGYMIVPANTVLTKTIINKIANNNVFNVTISEEDITSGAASEDGLLDLSELAATQSVDTNTVEYKEFKKAYDNNVEDFSDKINDIVHKNAPIDVDAMIDNTLDIVKATNSPLGILAMISTLKNYDDSTFHHSLNVSLICNIFAGWLGLDEKQTELVTACGLFHDIGKLLIPQEIIQKPGKLTDEEFQIIKTHPKKGYDLLKSKNVDPHIQMAALMHHEKCDGSGYPLGFKGDKIDWCAKIVTIADIYEAMTAKRVYRGPLSPFTVISIFEEDGLKKYEPHYILTFLEHVVNSYVNCHVKLSNGEEGDIIYINKVSLSKPLIKTNNSFIDLSKNSNIKIEQIL
ncbi:MAG: HD-GYP domain-containing protein [Lachnospiraceae bacterium]|nr:HD-GYP domain-containing protein [Lachnospiraceae bacterium]